MGSDEDDLNLRQIRLYLFRDLHAGTARHFDIQQDQVEEKAVFRYVVKQVAAGGIERNFPRAAALFQTGLGNFFMSRNGCFVIIADRYMQHKNTSLVLYYIPADISIRNRETGG